MKDTNTERTYPYTGVSVCGLKVRFESPGRGEVLTPPATQFNTCMLPGEVYKDFIENRFILIKE